MAPPTKYLLWCDLETTGGDEHRDPILEVGILLTDLELNIVADYQTVVSATDEQLSRMIPKVLTMHLTSGLLADVSHATMSLASVDEQIHERFSKLAQPGEFMLAGSGVAHFDRRFIVAQMPKLASLLGYAPFDVGQMRRLLRMLGSEELVAPVPASFKDGDKTHRAMDDIQAHLEEARQYRQLLAFFKQLTHLTDGPATGEDLWRVVNTPHLWPTIANERWHDQPAS